MTKDEYEALPKTQKAIFKILFTGGVHTARNIRTSIGDENMNVGIVVKALKEKDPNIQSSWRYQKGKGYFKVYYYKHPGEWEK